MMIDDDNEEIQINNKYETKIKQHVTMDVKMKTTLSDDTPVYQSPRRTTFCEKQIIDEQIKSCLEDRIIQPSCSQYASKIVLVKEKDETPFELMTSVKMRTKENLRIGELMNDDEIYRFEEKRDQVGKDAKLQIGKTQLKNQKTFNKKRKKTVKYEVNSLVAIIRTQFRIRDKLQIIFIGPYKVKRVIGINHYELRKEGEHEGPRVTTSSSDLMKKWSEMINSNRLAGASNCQKRPNVGFRIIDQDYQENESKVNESSDNEEDENDNEERN